jgi:hypothetical protein
MARTKNTTTATPAKNTKATKKTDTVDVAVPPVVEEPVEHTVSVFDQFSEFMAKLQAVSTQMSSLRTEFRSLERQVSKDLKAAAKVNQKRKRKTGNRAPSGFVKPTLISNELAAFLGKTQSSR